MSQNNLNNEEIDSDEEGNKSILKNKTKIFTDDNGKKVIKLREMTDLEKQYFNDARKRQRTNLIRPQVNKGKEFKGNSFICKPEIIEFKDFEVGQPYTQTIYLTNASYKKCGFSLIPMKESIRDFFEIIYKHPSQMPPGMSVALTIRFHPQLNQDIDDVFPILSETGRIDFPLKCTCKKAIVKIPDTVVDFKQVIYGEKGIQHLKLVNEGALPTAVTIKSAKGFDIMTKSETYSQVGSQIIAKSKGSQGSMDSGKEGDQQSLEQNLSQLKFKKSYVIQGYSTLNIPVTFEPTQIGNLELPLIVYFENYIHSPPIEVLFQGECIEVPIYVEKPLYDFEICLYNHIYREKIIFHNRSQNAMKIQIVGPKETKNFFEFNPMLGYIQGNSSFEVWVKMTADKDLLTLCHNYIVKEGVFEIPFKLIGADQVVPVPFVIRAQLTNDTLQIIPGKINFGKLYEGTASRMSLTCENLSDLPQELIFYPLPKEISVSLDLIPIKILPKEKFQTTLVYRSGKVLDNKKDEGYLRCKIITGTISTRDIRIPYFCDIIKCPLDFSAMKIDIPVMQIDESFNTHLMIKNTTYKDMIFEYFLPKYEICGLKITPMVEKIQAQKSQEINIEFKSFFKRLGAFTLDELNEKYQNDPSINFDQALRLQKESEKEKEQQQAQETQGKDQKKDSKKDSKKDTKKEGKLTKQQLQEQEAELKRQEELEKERLEQEKIKKEEIENNFDMEGQLAKLGGKLIEYHKGTDRHSQHYTWLIPFYFKYLDSPHTNKYMTYLEINTVTVQKSLVLDQILIDFGEIAVGVRETKDILISNFGENTANITMDLLPQFCGFSVINALRPCDAEQERQGKKKKLVVQFQPLEEQPYLETMKINCQTTCVSAKLIGKGVRPSVKVQPEDGLLNIGGVVLGEKCEKTFTIQNVSNFAVKFKITEKAKGIDNHRGPSVFAFIPQEAQIEANQSIEIKVVFSPDRISEKFFTYIGVDIPFQKDEKQIFIWGSCYPRSGFVRYYEPYLALPQLDSLQTQIERPFDHLHIKDEQNIFSPLSNKIVLEFKKIKIQSSQNQNFRVTDIHASNQSQNQQQIQQQQLQQQQLQEQQQQQEQEQDEKCFTRKIVLGNTKIYSDPKLEKAINFEVSMPKDDKLSYFSCDNLKAAVNPGQDQVVTFNFKPPQQDETIAHIESLQGLGQWKELKADLKITGGYLRPGVQDVWNFEIILRAYINQI